MALPASDTFTGSDGTNLTTYSANWSLNNGNFRLFSNALRPLGTGSVECVARWNADTFADNQYSKATVVALATSIYIGVAVRIATDGADTYYAFYTAAEDSYFMKYVAGAYTEYGVGDPVPVNSVMEIRAKGTTISALVDGVDWFSPVTDSGITSGAAGVSGFDTGTGSRIDTWEGGNLVTSLPPTQGPRMSMALLAR